MVTRWRFDDVQAPAAPAPPFYVATEDSQPAGGGPVFDFVDISTTGVDVTGAAGDDVLGGPVDIPFTFQFYGVVQTQLYVCSNGFVSFDSGSSSDFNGGAHSFPTSVIGPTVIAPLWVDLNASDQGTIKSQVVGNAPDRVLIVQWTDVPEFGQSPDSVRRVTMELKLFEDSANIEAHYWSVDVDYNLTIGIQRDSGDGLTYAVWTGSGAPPALDGRAIRWTWVVPTAPSGSTDSAVFAMNPNADGSPQYTKQFSKELMNVRPTPDIIGEAVVFETSDAPEEISFSGVFLAETQYDMFVYWYRKGHPVLLTDDLGRQFRIFIKSFVPKRAWSRSHPWRHTYDVAALVLGAPTGSV